ncbi:cell wall-associated NlpC family hydrolase [Kitasatospora sp. GAS204A]|uniref:C40 family peptidase n=1 Tax=unclassified Kitasatospora TaxID=2633591 RepID=UPI0024746990|nr:C40 family peptidase [Kitasatospora sp. GAS204B]MDH6121693.1 cell wall-associated NlpC family hydrolase [Kitasatospora sp. GAS204B]
MKPDLNPDLISADPIAGRPSSSAEHGAHHRAGRLRHRVGLAAAIVAGAGSIGLGADLASAAPLPEHLALSSGLVSADRSASVTNGDIHQGWDGSVYWFQNSAGEWRYTKHHDIYLNRIGSNSDNTGTGTGDIQQGWDGSVYWFQNSSGEWRYTSHRDTYLNRIGSNSDSSGSGSGTGTGTGDQSAATSNASSGDVEAAIAFAQAQLGKPFIWGGNGPDGYDCSGLTQQSFRRTDVSLPRIADEQYSATTPVSASRMQRGDLLFWSYDGSVSGIHHVAIYLGDNRYIEAAHPGTTVRISHLNSGYFPSFVSRP